jgi:hypothetical protein
MAFLLLLLLIVVHLATNSNAMSSRASSVSKVVSRCACEKIVIEIDLANSNQEQAQPAATSAVACHCRHCRKYHIAAFVNYLQVDNSNAAAYNPVSIVQGQDSIFKYKDVCDEIGPVERWQCRHCHSKLVTCTDPTPTTTENSSVTSVNNTTMLINMGPLDDSTIPKGYSKRWKRSLNWQVSQQATWVQAKPLPRPSKSSRRGKKGNMPRPPSQVITGGCACRKHCYQIKFSYPSEFQHCYCHLCRQLSGGPFATWVPVEPADFKWTNDKPPLVRTTSFGRRHICSDCGGVLTIVYDGENSVWPAAGGWDDASVPVDDADSAAADSATDSASTGTTKMSSYMSRVVHICCRWKPLWYDIPVDGMDRLDDAC